MSHRRPHACYFFYYDEPPKPRSIGRQLVRDLAAVTYCCAVVAAGFIIGGWLVR